MDETAPPHDRHAERQLIGTILADPRAVHEAIGVISEE